MAGLSPTEGGSEFPPGFSTPDMAPVPDPGVDDFARLIRRRQRGLLKVYLGACPGAGKTYQMLKEGNWLKSLGIDIVIGYVEMHEERPETIAQIDGLEIIPPRLIPYRGIGLKEMDVDAVLARKPAVALVDELAHTNAPGSRRGKRFEEVEELLHAGICVLSAVNIGHLESLHKAVEQTTGVPVQERVPDEVVMSADRLVTIDLPSEDLRGRLQAGKIYGRERAQQAMENFFTEKNLTRLREMSLSFTELYRARKQREASGPGQGGVGRVAAALSSRGHDPWALLRETSRLAGLLNTPWRAVYVRTPHEAPHKIDTALQRKLTDTLELAQQMGGTAVVVKNDDVAEGLIAFARENGITHLVMGRPARRHAYRWFSQSVLEVLMRELAEVNIVLV
jgi:two-component system sensor histidine kinase KdpD